MPTRDMALAAYRHLLRSTRIAFQGDLPTLIAARRAAREGFESKRNLSLDSTEASEGIQHAENVSKVLRENVVQGQAIEGKENSYKLRIHEYTERGDNETVKIGKDQNTLAGVKCSNI